jgi:hypothetical protein
MTKRNPTPGPAAETWAARWLDSVAAGTGIMSRRLLRSIDARGGGLIFVRGLARQRGVHLVLLADGRGEPWVAASNSPFRIVC